MCGRGEGKGRKREEKKGKEHHGGGGGRGSTRKKKGRTSQKERSDCFDFFSSRNVIFFSLMCDEVNTD